MNYATLIPRVSIAGALGRDISSHVKGARYCSLEQALKLIPEVLTRSRRRYLVYIRLCAPVRALIEREGSISLRVINSLFWGAYTHLPMSNGREISVLAYDKEPKRWPVYLTPRAAGVLSLLALASGVAREDIVNWVLLAREQAS